MDADASYAGLHFTDPSTTVGAEVEITADYSSSSTTLESLEATLTYDTEMLRFISGDSTTGGGGTLTISGSGSGSSIKFVMKFQALKEGTARVEVAQASGVDSSGEDVEITLGSSAVTIGPGDPSLITEEEGSGDGNTGEFPATGPQVEIDGAQYVITNDIPDMVVPQGFERGEFTFEGMSCQAVTQAISGESALYMTPAGGGDPDFFMYNSDEGTFFPFEQVEIASERFLVLLRDDGNMKVPDQYQETKLTIEGKEFTAWQDPSDAEYYIVYGLNADGQKLLYKYDTVDRTYQRYVEQISAQETEKKKAAKGLWGKILQFIEDMLDIMVIITIMLILVLVGVLIVIGVKLNHRNIELDDLYDEYGIDADDDDDELPVRKKKSPPASPSGKGKKTSSEKSKNGSAVRVPVKTMNLREEFDDYEDEFDDYDDEDDYEDEFDSYDESDYEDDFDYEEDDDDNEDDGRSPIQDLDELLSAQSKKKRSHMEKDDAFQVDFIDLD